MTEFLEKCADAGPEAPLYTPLANLYNRGLELLDALDPLPEDAKALKLHFSVNDPHRLCDRVFKYGLSPDLKSLLESLQQGAVAEINWTNVIKCVEVKAKDSPALCGGEYDPRPLHDGKDPVANNHPRTVPPPKASGAKASSIQKASSAQKAASPIKLRRPRKLRRPVKARRVKARRVKARLPVTARRPLNVCWPRKLRQALKLRWAL
ncbi:hypothetical protein CPB85DRAFT_876403 [Mucidula mucida]|nr:hypothetical protein CPB85DRAFT_876403 [Mucidula mucida]